MLLQFLVLLFAGLCNAHTVHLPADPHGTDQLTGDFILYGSQRNEVLKTLRDVSHGEVFVNAPYAGKFQYCFLNENSGIETKDVTFNVYGVVYVDLDDPNTRTLDGSVRQLSKLVREVKNEQSYIVIRERTHRNTAESTNDRVKWWSVFQLVVVIANSLFQIYYLKRFFEVTSYV
ncbi:p24 complex component [Kluyveromyces marxianus]|nr:p24 complex component [Kluyveromyces marxianus]